MMVLSIFLCGWYGLESVALADGLMQSGVQHVGVGWFFGGH